MKSAFLILILELMIEGYNMKKLMFKIIILLNSIFILTANAALIPRQIPSDKHIKIVNFDPNNVIVIQGKYGYQTQIVFAPNETVKDVSIGDSMAWQAVPVNNNLFIKPVTSSNTNMTVLTNLNSYNFQLNSTELNITPTYKLQFVYPASGYDAEGNTNMVGTCDPTKINWKYSFTGDRALAPIEAFDCNGQFTYLRFKNITPAIFMVDKNKKETLINYHMQGNYLVVNTVAKQFTLRDGNYVTTLYNDNAIGDWQSIK